MPVYLKLAAEGKKGFGWTSFVKNKVLDTKAIEKYYEDKGVITLTAEEFEKWRVADKKKWAFRSTQDSKLLGVPIYDIELNTKKFGLEGVHDGFYEIRIANMFFDDKEVILGNTIIKECQALDAAEESSVYLRLQAWLTVLIAMNALANTMIDGVKFIKIYLDQMDIGKKTKSQYNIIKNQFVQKKNQYVERLKSLIYDLNRIGLDLRLAFMFLQEYGPQVDLKNCLRNTRIVIKNMRIYNQYIDYDKGWQVCFEYVPGDEAVKNYTVQYEKELLETISIIDDINSINSGGGDMLYYK